jgi:hypothetical protein
VLPGVRTLLYVRPGRKPEALLQAIDKLTVAVDGLEDVATGRYW